LARRKLQTQNKFELIQTIESSSQVDLEASYEKDVNVILDKVEKIYGEE